MMQKFVNEEFIRKDKSFRADALDFYGECSPLSEREKREFLEKYYLYFQKRYGDDVAYRKAVSEDQAKEKSKSLLLEQNSVNFHAYTRKVKEKYSGWHLYTDRATVVENTVRLSDEAKFPVPCAKYEYDYRIGKIKFSVRIGKEYHCNIFGGIRPTTTGRFIEFRKGCAEVVKLYFSPDGRFFYKDGRKKSYHYELKEIASYAFGAWNQIEIRFGKKSFVLRFGEEEHTFAYTKNLIPDNIFFSGGMQSVDGWEIRFDEIRDQCEKLRHPFVETQKEPVKEERIGDVALPFAIGKEKNKDRVLVLKGEFIARTDRKTICSVETLDPGGDLLVNGKRVFHTDGFEPFDVDLTPYIKEGVNKLELDVNPRAPEVLYSWHKHRDYYNAWLCGDVKIIGCKTWVRDSLRVVTKRAREDRAEFDVRFSLTDEEWTNGDWSGADYRITLQKIFPEIGKEELLETGQIKGKEFCRSFQKEVALWTLENPTLYKISAEFVKNGSRLWKGESETGFRTVLQENGEIYLNGEKIVLKGALNMQFLPTYEEIPVNHVCPQTWQIVQQAMAIKAMNGNCMRLHQLGYGTNDPRFADVCDRLGVLLIWTTRLIDGVENLMWTEHWKQAEIYRKQIRKVINHPSIIMWEGSNELHSDLKKIDRIYDEFVSAVKSEDETRLICPVSHLYYGGGIYDCGCDYYNTDGTKNAEGEAASASFGWKDRNVVRSAHTYCLLLGYGSSWRNMATQNWRWQSELFEEKQKAYIVSEFAIIGRQNPETEEAKLFINTDSYELSDESDALGFGLNDGEWRLSQAFQALCAEAAVKQLLRRDVDGMLWCCLWGGANNGSYLKPVLDFYGYKKLAFYELTEKFQKIVAFNAASDVLFGENYQLQPVVCGTTPGKEYKLCIEIVEENGNLAENKTISFVAEKKITETEKVSLAIKDGYYTIRYTVEEIDRDRKYGKKPRR